MNLKMRKVTVVASLIALVLIAAMLIFGIAAIGHGNNEQTNAFVSQVLGFISIVIVALVALLKTEDTENKVNKLHDDMKNGLIAGKMNEVLDSRTEKETENGR